MVVVMASFACEVRSSRRRSRSSSSSRSSSRNHNCSCSSRSSRSKKGVVFADHNDVINHRVVATTKA